MVASIGGLVSCRINSTLGLNIKTLSNRFCGVISAKRTGYVMRGSTLIDWSRCYHKVLKFNFIRHASYPREA